MKILIQLCLLSLQILIVAKSIQGATFSIVHPKIFRLDTDEKIVVNLHGYGNAGVSVFASLTDYPLRRNVFGRKTTNGNANTPVEFNMKVSRENLLDDQTIKNQRVELNIRITFTSGRHRTIGKKIYIYLTGESDYIFVQTERPIYKPGETVKIRVVPLDADMLPVRRLASRAFNYVEVTVQTAEGVGIWKKRLRFPDDAFPTADYKIPDDPPLANYYVSAKIQNKYHTTTGKTMFKIDKYVLPLYNVEVKLDQNTVKPGGDIKGTLKATYSYGEPVVGSYAISAFLHVPDRPPIEIFTKPSSYRKRPGMLWQSSEGKADIKILTTEAPEKSNMTWEEIIDAKATISFIVSVVGKTEGIEESTSKKGILITNTPYTIDVSHTSKYFVPGMIHDINVIVRDVVTNERVPGIKVVVVQANGERSRTYKCDKQGATKISLETSNVDEIQVTVVTAEDTLNDASQAKNTFTLYKFSSNHGYLKMSAPSHAAIDETIYVNFRTKGHTPDEIYYMVLSRGAIIDTGKKAHGQTVSTQRLQITRKMSPSIRVVGYFVNNNYVVSDSLTIDVEDACISKELTITLEFDEVKPGNGVRLTYRGEPGALVGTLAVDRSAYFLNNEGRLDRAQMFDKMRAFDMGCSVTGGSDSFDVFQEAGLALATSYRVTPSVSEINCTKNLDQLKRRKRSPSSVEEVYINEALAIKCARNGKRENLADIRCETRAKEILKQDMSDEDKILCHTEFIKECIWGEKIRSSSASTSITARQSGGSGGIISTLDYGHVRTDFKEAWLFTNIELNNNGKAEQKKLPPDSITTYDIDAISVHDTQGFCVAKPVEVKVFKDFFIKLYLPYSVKVMEQVQIRGAVFNYDKRNSRTFQLSMKSDEHICTSAAPGEWSHMTLEVLNGSSKSFIFTIIPLSVPKGGSSEIKLKAAFSGGVRDSIVKRLKIENLGSEEEFTGSFELNPRFGTQQIKFKFPDIGVLPDTRKCWIYGHMNFLGPIIEFDEFTDTPNNVANSLKKPYGCGEQNMAHVGPNVYVLEYLSFRNRATDNVREKIKTYIIEGYTRQQGHRNGERWSVWSQSPPSLWLNAYVNKAFLSARTYWMDMDINPICQSLNWLASIQQQDGSFHESASHRFKRINVAEGVEVALTAYVLIAFAENPPPDCPDRSLSGKILEAQEKAFNYLKREVNRRNTMIPYTKAITAYAMALFDKNDRSTIKINQRLLALKYQSDDSIFWKGKSLTSHQNSLKWHKENPSTIDIETTAYALLAQVTMVEGDAHQVYPSTVHMINMIARWMISQKNEQGGFSSSQTTVMAIQSITKYAKWYEDLEPPPRNPHLNVKLTSEGITSWHDGQVFTLDESNEFYRKELEIPNDVVIGSRKIEVDVTAGQGRGSLSYRCIYRQTKDSDICHFNIIATTEMIGLRGLDGTSEANPGEGMNVIKLVLEISKTTPGDTGMAIVDISMMSGFTPVRASIEDIKKGKVVDGVLDDDTESDGKIQLYVEKIPGSDNPDGPLRFGFKMQQLVEVKNISPAKIIVYDYYQPKTTCSKFYTVPGNSPMLRTSCSPGGTTQEQCKCAEGACPKCRTRAEQLDKTCDIDNNFGCLNIRDRICESDYGMLAQVMNIDKISVPEFVRLEAQVSEVWRSKMSDTGVLNHNRTFMIRKDCFEKCQDDVLKSKKGNKNYFNVGQTFLLSGRKPEQILKSGGDESFDYYLDSIGMIERLLSAPKCKKYREKWGEKCEENSGLAQCDKVKICDNMDNQKKEIAKGCD